MTTDIETILKTTIQTKVIEAFNQTPEMIEKLVTAALSKEVSEHGGPPSRYDRTSMPYMDWLVGEEIRQAVHQAVKEYIATHKPQIAERVESVMQNTEFGKEVGTTISKILSEEWRWTVNLDIQRDTT